MLGAAVVPERQRVRCPLQPAPQPWRGVDVPVEHVQHRPALASGQPLDVRREALIHEEDLPPRLGMARHHRMFVARIAARRRLGLVGADVRNRPVVNRRQPVEERLDGRGEHLVGEVHVREQRVAATAGGRFGDVEHGTERRHLVAGDVRMPAVPGRVRRLGRRLHRENLRIAAVLVLHRMHMQPPETPPERLVLLAVQLLIPKHQHLPVQPRIVDVLRGFVAEWRRQVHIAHLGTDMRRQGRHLERAVGGADVAARKLIFHRIEHRPWISRGLHRGLA